MKTMRMRFLIRGLLSVILLGSGCYPNPEGGAGGSIFIQYDPALAGGDGLTYETAYHFKGGLQGNLERVEYEIIQRKYWAPLHRSEDEFVYKYYHKIPCVTETRNKRIHHIFTFNFPDGAHTIYFEVTNYYDKNLEA